MDLRKKEIDFSSWIKIVSGIPKELKRFYRSRKNVVSFPYRKIVLHKGFSQFQVAAAQLAYTLITKSTQGGIILFFGPMRSGKSAALYKLSQLLCQSGQRSQAFFHVNDFARTGGRNVIMTRGNGHIVPAKPYRSILDLLAAIRQSKPGETILSDEIQFAEGISLRLLKQFRHRAKKQKFWMVFGGLDFNFRRETWKSTEIGVEVADRVVLLPAQCEIKNCRSLAYLSQRTIDGQPAFYTDPEVLVGAEDKYYPSCVHHHTIRYHSV
jgi:thymidine kinase